MEYIKYYNDLSEIIGEHETPVVINVKSETIPMFITKGEAHMPKNILKALSVSQIGDTTSVSIEERLIANIGDIAYYDGTKIKFKSKEEFSATDGTPIGIAVIPGSISPSGKNYCISLVNMDASKATEGSADNLYDGSAPEITATYTNSKGAVTENVKVSQTDGYALTTFDGWYGRVNSTPIYATKRVISDTEIGDVEMTRYQVTGQLRQKFAPSRAIAVTNKFTTFPAAGIDGGTTLIPGPSGSSSSVKGYISQYYYNPLYAFDNGDVYTTGFQDPTFASHYWYSSCTEGNAQKLRIPSPITENNEFNSKWMLSGSMTSDFNGKANTMALVNDAIAGVANSNGELIKWDGTAEALWKPYKVSGPASDCTNGYDETGKTWKNTNYTQATSPVEWYYFPTKFNSSGSLMDYWNYGALTCHCFAPANSGTSAGDWYLPASGELGFALAFAKEINESIDALKDKGYPAVGLARPVSNTNNSEVFSFTYANNPYYRGNEYQSQILLSSTAFDDSQMVTMYMGHASFFASNINQASRTRAFIQI